MNTIHGPNGGGADEPFHREWPAPEYTGGGFYGYDEHSGPQTRGIDGPARRPDFQALTSYENPWQNPEGYMGHPGLDDGSDPTQPSTPFGSGSPYGPVPPC